MSNDKIKDLEAQVEASRQEKHTQFLVALAEDLHLPATALKSITRTFEGGYAASVALSEVMEGQTLALSDNEVDDDVSAGARSAIAKLELSDSVVIGRQALRNLLTEVASAGRTALSEADTREVPGRPPAKSGNVALSEFEGLTPAETVAKVNEAESAGRI